MEEKPNYFAIIPANVRYDEELKLGEKMMYGEITSLTYKTGECWASNNYFANLYKVTPQAISKWIKALEQHNYITISYEKEGKLIIKRIIKLVSTEVDRVSTEVERGINSSLEGYQHRIKENNTSINTTSINKKEIYKERFKKPTLEEVEQYCKQRNSSVDPKVFYEYFEVGNWIDSKGNKVKNWKQKIITWEKQQPKQKTANEEIVPDWFNKDLNKKEEKKESDLTDEQKDRIKRLLANSGK